MNDNHENTMKKLEEYRKEPGFTSPEGYYDDLYTKMMERVSFENVKTNNHNRFLWISLVGGAAAAAVALLVTFTLFNQDTPSETLAETKTPILLSEQAEIEDNTLAVAIVSQIDENEIADKPIASSNRNSQTIRQTISNSSNSEKDLNDEDPLYSVLEFYEDDLLSDQFQEVLMDLECYYDF